MGAIKSKFRRSKSATRKDENGKKPAAAPKKKKKAVNLPESQSARKTVDPRLPFSNYRQIFSIRNAWKAIQRSMQECASDTMIRFLHQHPAYKTRYSRLMKYTDEEEMRKEEVFENIAMDIYGIFDGVISELEAVDKALDEIQYSAPSTHFNHKMLQDYQEPFIEIIRQHLGSDRFTETTENNYKLLFEFVQQELLQLLDDEPIPELDVQPNVVNVVEVKTEATVEVAVDAPSVVDPVTTDVDDTKVADETPIINPTDETQVDPAVNDSEVVSDDQIEVNLGVPDIAT